MIFLRNFNSIKNILKERRKSLKLFIYAFSEPVDFSRNVSTKPIVQSSDTTQNSNRSFSTYSMDEKKTLGMLRSVSSDDMVKSSDENTDDDESDVDIIGDPKGYMT